MFGTQFARPLRFLAFSKISSALTATLVASVMIMGLSLPASAFVINQLADFDNGTPCDETSPPAGACDLYEVTGLVTDDVFTVDWDFTRTIEDPDNTTVGDVPALRGDGVCDPGEPCITDVVDVTATFTVDLLDGDTMTLSVTMTNSSDSTGPITSLGITTGSDSPLDASSSLVTNGTYFDMFALDAGTGGSGDLDACVFSTNCFTGTSTGGIPDDGSLAVRTDTFTVDLVALDGTFDGTLDHFVIKFQGDPQSFELPGTPCCGDPKVEIPEPTTLLLFATGLLGLGVLARRRRTT